MYTYIIYLYTHVCIIYTYRPLNSAPMTAHACVTHNQLHVTCADVCPPQNARANRLRKNTTPSPYVWSHHIQGPRRQARARARACTAHTAFTALSPACTFHTRTSYTP